MRTCNCPGCGANLSFDDSDREFAFCEYCGAKVMFDDYRSTHRVVDEARIHEDETDRMIRMRELDMEEKERKRSRKGGMFGYIAAAVMAAAGIIIALCSGSSGESYGAMLGMMVALAGAMIALETHTRVEKLEKQQEEARNARAGLIKLPQESAKFLNKSFEAVETAYKSLGFQNVTLINLRDLRSGVVKRPGLVKSVTINGEAPSGDKWYHPTASVVITYHGFITDK